MPNDFCWAGCSIAASVKFFEKKEEKKIFIVFNKNVKNQFFTKYLIVQKEKE